MKLALFGPRILVRCEPVGERMVGRIIIQDKHSERTRFADVVAVGDDVRKQRTKWWHFRIGRVWFGGTPIYAPGDRVMISWYTGAHIHILEDDLFGNKPDEDLDRFVMESEILGKVIPD